MSQDRQKSELTRLCAQFITVETDLANMKKEKKRLEEVGKQLSLQIEQIMDEIDETKLGVASGGEIVKHTKKIKRGMTKKYLLQQLESFFDKEKDKELVENLARHVLDNRPQIIENKIKYHH